MVGNSSSIFEFQISSLEISAPFDFANVPEFLVERKVLMISHKM